MQRLLVAGRVTKFLGKTTLNSIFWLRRPCGHPRGVRDKHDNEPCMACMIEFYDDNPDYRRTQ